jgi:hypothetical protein
VIDSFGFSYEEDNSFCRSDYSGLFRLWLPVVLAVSWFKAVIAAVVAVALASVDEGCGLDHRNPWSRPAATEHKPGIFIFCSCPP